MQCAVGALAERERRHEFEVDGELGVFLKSGGVEEGEGFEGLAGGFGLGFGGGGRLGGAWW